MSNTLIPQDSLVVYKKHPARLIHASDKLEIELADGERLRVRPKDILPLHPRPLSSQDLKNIASSRLPKNDIETAWEILILEANEAQPLSLSELAELVYGEFTPATAWACWQILDDGLYFTGSVDHVQTRSKEEFEQEREHRQERAAELKAWQDFVQRAHSGNVNPLEDKKYLSELADLAFERRTDSRLLRELGQSEMPSIAHARLLEWGVWDQTVNPYPRRFDLPTTAPEISLPDLSLETRLDLTHLPVFAIDDQDNQDPDDALSLEENWLWVHVADVAALVTPDSLADQEARARGANLYLPEGTVNMLPTLATSSLGLGLSEFSPALSFGMELDTEGSIQRIEITPSWVQVQRLSYEQVEQRLEAESVNAREPFRNLERLAQVHRQRRLAAGGSEIDLPETIVRVTDGQVFIRPVMPYRSRMLVKEAMLMAGEAAARYAIQNHIPFPFTTQDPPDPLVLQENLSRLHGHTIPADPDLARAFALRKSQKRSQVSSQPGLHAGLGLEYYARVTSPLRRYADLVAHQQLRAYLTNNSLITEPVLLEHVRQGEAAAIAVSQAESLSRRHWTLVYLSQQHQLTGWQGEGVLVDKRSLRGRVLIPELALETQFNLRRDLPLNTIIHLTLREVNLPLLEASFR